MNNLITGKVAKLDEKSGTGPRGPYRRHAFLLADENGEEMGWYTYGFTKPPFTEGAWVAFEAETRNGYNQVVKGSLNQIGAPVNAPAMQRAPDEAPPRSHSQASRSHAQAHTQSAGSPDKRSHEIVWQHSQEMSIRLLNALAISDALPLEHSEPAARKTEMLALVSELTAHFYNEVFDTQP